MPVPLLCCCFLAFCISFGGCAPKVLKPTLPDSSPISQVKPPVKKSPQVYPPASSSSQGETTAQARKVYVLPDISFVEKRITAYKHKKTDWENQGRELTSLGRSPKDDIAVMRCQKRIEAILDGYQSLWSRLKGMRPEDITSEDSNMLGENYKDDFNFLDGECAILHAGNAALLARRQEEVSASATKDDVALFKQYIAEGRLADAQTIYGTLSRTSPAETMKIEVQKAYCLLLVRQGQYEKAAEVLRGLITTEREEPVYSWSVLRQLADLHFALGRIEDAKTNYLSLAREFSSQGIDDPWVVNQLSLLTSPEEHGRELALYSAVLKEWMPFDGKHIPAGLKTRVVEIEGAFPGTKYAERAHDLLVMTETRARNWAQNTLALVRLLLAEEELGLAESLMEELKAAGVPFNLEEAQQLEKAQQGQGKFDSAEKFRQEEEGPSDQEVIQQQWDEANRLFEARRFDEALEAYGSLLNSVHGDNARVKIQEAKDLAAAEKRQEAADLFVKAQKISDIHLKKERLLASRRLLQEILIKYPEAAVAGKVRQNLKTVTEYIYQVDPGLLTEE